MKFLSISHCVATRHLIQALTINMVPLSTYNQCTVSAAQRNNNNDPQYTIRYNDKRIDRFLKSRQEQETSYKHLLSIWFHYRRTYKQCTIICSSIEQNLFYIDTDTFILYIHRPRIKMNSGIRDARHFYSENDKK